MVAAYASETHWPHGGLPVNGPGKVQVRVRRALMAAAGAEVSTSQVLAWVYPRRQKIHNQQRRRVREVLEGLCERVRLERRGRSFVCVWRALGPVGRAQPHHPP